MQYSELMWEEESSRRIFETRIFSVREIRSRSPSGEVGSYVTLEAGDWAIVVPVLPDGRFVMVRQWRHGARELGLEFPGGVIEAGEEGAAAAARELREETGCVPGRIRKLGIMSPNPAIMTNRVHFFLAEDVRAEGAQSLDRDEYVGVETVPRDDVIRGMGRPPYTHALMASALMLYLRDRPSGPSSP